MLVPEEEDRLTALKNTRLRFSYNTHRVLAEQLKAPVPRMIFYRGEMPTCHCFHTLGAALQESSLMTMRRKGLCLLNKSLM